VRAVRPAGAGGSTRAPSLPRPFPRSGGRTETRSRGEAMTPAGPPPRRRRRCPPGAVTVRMRGPPHGRGRYGRATEARAESAGLAEEHALRDSARSDIAAEEQRAVDRAYEAADRARRQAAESHSSASTYVASRQSATSPTGIDTRSKSSSS
jgi:hypothetical protein